ncbi:hypothetical protein FB451DRAFT_1524438 [Mycena latifolia]|nr:hypothetical protein FB451DRAFT_1524438 [Mycena latifolia]
MPTPLAVRPSVMHSERELVARLSARQHSLLTSSERAGRTVSRASGTGTRHCGARRRPSQRCAHSGDEPQRVEHLVEEREHAREVVRVVLRVRRGLVQCDDLRREIIRVWSTHQCHPGERRAAPHALARARPAQRAARTRRVSASLERISKRGCTERGLIAGGKDDEDDEGCLDELDTAGRVSSSEASKAVERWAAPASGALGSGVYLAERWGQSGGDEERRACCAVENKQAQPVDKEPDWDWVRCLWIFPAFAFGQ